MVLLVDSGGSKAGKTLSVCGLVSRRPGPWPPAVRPAGACASPAQHLLWEVCADSPAPRHRLFLAAVTVHTVMKTKTLPASSFPGTPHKGPGLPGDPGLGPLTMHCLWSWVTARVARGTGAPPPVVLREARGLDQPGLEGCEVGAGAWDQAAFP